MNICITITTNLHYHKVDNYGQRGGTLIESKVEFNKHTQALVSIVKLENLNLNTQEHIER